MEQGDIQVQIMPLFHVGGAKNLWGYYFAAATNVIMPQISFDPEATLKAIHDEKATDIHIVPTHLAAFLASPHVDDYDLSKLKRMFYAASPMPLELLKRGMEKWGPIFLQFYGATEDGPNVTYLSKQQHRLVIENPEKGKFWGRRDFPISGSMCGSFRKRARTRRLARWARSWSRARRPCWNGGKSLKTRPGPSWTAGYIPATWGSMMKTATSISWIEKKT